MQALVAFVYKRGDESVQDVGAIEGERVRGLWELAGFPIGLTAGSQKTQVEGCWLCFGLVICKCSPPSPP